MRTLHAMKAVMVLAWAFFLSVPCSSRERLDILFWNVENFFDWRNGGTSVSDADFSSFGARHWTRKRFYAKCNAIAKSLLWVSSKEGRLPDIVALAEVENAFVLRRLLQSTALSKTDYAYVHFDSPDHRGIDVALLYRKKELELLDAKSCHIYDPADSSVLVTRDILFCRFRQRRGGREVSVLVNHHPSKYGGMVLSEPKRRLAVGRLRELVDSLDQKGINPIVATGDFNDTPENPVYSLLEEVLVPLHRPLFQRGEGTIKYDGRWDLIDQAYVSQTLIDAHNLVPMTILRIPFLLTRDTAHFGEKPLRTYVGPRYTAGVSDHLPILLRLSLE